MRLVERARHFGFNTVDGSVCLFFSQDSGKHWRLEYAVE